MPVVVIAIVAATQSGPGTRSIVLPVVNEDQGPVATALIRVFREHREVREVSRIEAERWVFVNHVLEGNVPGAAREVARFVLNTTVGLAGLFDVASRAGLEKRDADTRQTLGFYGVGPGPYLVVPLLPPLTVRDAIGYVVDTLLDPLGYFVPMLASTGSAAGKTVNERSLNLALYRDVEDSVLDLYAAVRSGYLQRRQRQIEQRRKELESYFASVPSSSLPPLSMSER